jgi:hypothetical protein
MQPAARPDRDADRAPQAGQDQGEARPAIRACTHRRSARSMRFSIATAWSSAEWHEGIKPREHLFPFPTSPTTCGAPLTRVSSCPPIGAPAIRSPSPALPAATCSPARRSPPPRKPIVFQRLRPFSRSTAYPIPSTPTMAFRSQALMRLNMSYPSERYLRSRRFPSLHRPAQARHTAVSS